MSMITLKVTFEIKLHEGRLEQPYGAEDNWDLWFYDQFAQTRQSEYYLRQGEYIKVTGCEELTD
jgi:hypothetical protein